VTSAVANARAHEEERRRAEALAEIDRAKTAWEMMIAAATKRDVKTILLTPTLDGRETTFFEWQGSGLYRPGQPRGSMYGGSNAFGVLRFGFDLEALHLRLDPAESSPRVTEVGNHLRVELVCRGRQVEVDFELQPDGQRREGRAPGGLAAGQAAFLDVLEISIPFAPLGLAGGDKVALAIHVLRSQVEVERLPRYGFVTVIVPDHDFDGVHWRV
jgi:hypothetical protein